MSLDVDYEAFVLDINGLLYGDAHASSGNPNLQKVIITRQKSMHYHSNDM